MIDYTRTYTKWVAAAATITEGYNDAEGFQVLAEELMLSIMDLLDYENLTCRLLRRVEEPWLPYPPPVNTASCVLEAATWTALHLAQFALWCEMGRQLSADLLRFLALEAELGELSVDAVNLLVHPDALPDIKTDARVTDPTMLEGGYIGAVGKTVVHTIAEPGAVPPKWIPSVAYALPDYGDLGKVWLGKPEVTTDFAAHTITVSLARQIAVTGPVVLVSRGAT